MTTQRKPLHTHVITVLFVLFQFIQFFPSSLVSSLTASAETNNSVTLFSDDKGSGDATWSLSEDGKLITWDITVTQNESETEAAPSVEVVVPKDVGPPQLVSATPAGVFNTSGNTHTFNSPYSTTAQTLTLTFTTAVSDLTSQNLEFNIGASIQAKDNPAAATLQSVSIPNKLAQLEAQRIAEQKAEAERIAAEEKAEAERLATEKAAQEEADRLTAEQATQEEADKKAEEEQLAKEKADKKAAELEAQKAEDEKAAQEEERLAAEEAAEEAKQEAEELEAEKGEKDKAAQEKADKKAESEQAADEEEKTEEAVDEEIEENDLSEEAVPEEDKDTSNESDVTEVTSPPSNLEEAEQEVSITEKEEVSEKENDVEALEEEYDPGDMLDGFEATDHPDDPTPITRFAPGSLGSASTLLKSSRSVMQSTTDLEPGEVRTNKTATPVDGMVNTWDITLRIEGRDAQEVETTDVVLVIDRSGSMAFNQRMENAKTAANNFITTMIPDDSNLRIAVVSFSSNHDGAQLVTTNSNFSRSTGTLTSAVNSLTAAGGTHTQAGIIQGQNLLTGSGADNKYMVLLSDGEPTFSYEPDNWTTVSETKRGAIPLGGGLYATSPQFLNYDNEYGVYDGTFDVNSVVGSGSSVTSSATTYSSRYWPFISNSNLEYYPAINDSPDDRPVNLQYVNNGDAAIKAGQDARTGFDGLFTIAVEAGSTGTSILNDISSPGLSYSTDNPGELTEIYDEIGTQISTQYALRNVELIDEMGDGFSLIDGTIVTSEGNTSVDGNDTITWTINPAVENLVDGTDDVRYAELTYRVEINDDILDLTGAKTDEHQFFDTNDLTQLSYTDTNDQNQTVNIDSPEVDPVLMKVKKILEGIEQDDRQFIVEISNDDSAYNQTESLIPNTDYIWITTLRYEGLYDVEETGITGPGNTDLARFITSYDVDGADTTTFEVNHIDGIPRGDVTIDVTNREISFIDLTALKVWEGGPEENKEPVVLTLWRTVDGETLSEVNVAPDPDVTPAEGPADEFVYTWADLPNETSEGSEYTYYFTESEVEGYTREYSNSTEINDELYGVFDEQYQGTVTNIYQIPADDIEATKTWINGENVRPDLWFQLRRSIDALEIDEAVDVMKLPVANDAEETVSVIFTDIELTDNDGNAYTFYVVEGTLVDGEFIPGTPENFEQSGEGLALTNTYKIPTTTANATKYWIGSEKDKHVQVDLKLWRTLDSETIPEEVLDFELLTVTPEDGISDEFYYVWSGLDKTDASGNEYIYYFTEDEVSGYDRIYSEPTIFGDVEYQPSGGSVTNQQMTIDFSFTKVDEEGNPLEGSEFTLEREDDGTLITNDGVNPVFNFAGLTEGRYILTETKAPPGYNLPTTPWIIEVVRNEESGELEIIILDDSFLSVTADGYALENNEQGEFPQTGGVGVVSYLSFGMLAIFSSIGFYLKKEENGGY